MTDLHPILRHPFQFTPPPELVEQWSLSAWAMPVNEWVTDVATQAARWGSDQELEACCEVLRQKGVPAWSMLRSNRRPQPPSLKEQALEVLERSCFVNQEDETIIRRALEQLDD